jgi:hypothetical protein
VKAVAYKVGKHIDIDAGQYMPGSSTGRGLLAHELTHVVQQHGVNLPAMSSLRVEPVDSPAESESRRASERFGIGHALVGLTTRPVAALARQPAPRPAPVDERAQRIINLAADTSRSIEERGRAVIQAIIDTYFPEHRDKIGRIVFDEPLLGLDITDSGRGAATTGNILFGSRFVESTTQQHFARRVQQVRHEIEHVEQYRAGMTGANRSDEREFIAHYHGTTFQELPGTGRIQHSTRVNMIDGALGYYYCLSPVLREANATRRDELVARRATSVRRSGRDDLGDAPTTCTRPRRRT